MYDHEQRKDWLQSVGARFSASPRPETGSVGSERHRLRDMYRLPARRVSAGHCLSSECQTVTSSSQTLQAVGAPAARAVGTLRDEKPYVHKRPHCEHTCYAQNRRMSVWP